MFTGTIYREKNVNGFVDLAVSDKSVVVIKTHMLPLDIFDKAVLIVRDPFDALVAEWNRKFGGPLGCAPKSSFQSDGGLKWKRYVYEGIQQWRDFNIAWHHHFATTGNLHVLPYELLAKKTKVELTKLLAFLNITPIDENLKWCMSRKEGFNHRKKPGTRTV